MSQRPTKKLQIYEILKQAIVSGAIKPGEILNEAELAQKYETGKTPTREALLLLTHENLLEALPRVGYIVPRLTTRDLLEIFSLRALLEVEAIGLAVDRLAPAVITALERNNREESQILAENSAQVSNQAYQLNREFHMIIARASGNQRLEKILQDLLNDLERALSFDPYSADPSQHIEIINSLKAHDKVRAQEAIRAHLNETRLRILKVV
jgi:DNA-binding GntR family transcriptional regulator